MKLSANKIDDAILALMYLGLHEGNKVWKGFDWEAMARLYEKGYISNPVTQAKSVELTEEGLRESKRLIVKLFSAPEK